MAPRGDRSAPTRDSILQAAARVFVRRGPFGATVREISEAAGVTVPAVYYHFKGISDLYDTVVREGRAHFRILAERALGGSGEAADRLRRLARTYARFSQEDPTRLRLLCMELFRPDDPAQPERGATELRGWIESRIRELIDDDLGGGPERTELGTRLVMSMLGGLLVEQARDPHVSVLDEDLAEAAIEALLYGLRAAQAPPKESVG